MSYVRTVSIEQAEGTLRGLYEEDLKSQGYVQNYTKALSLRPEIMAAYRQLSRAIRTNLDLRRYELITVAVAARLRCSY